MSPLWRVLSGALQVQLMDFFRQLTNVTYVRQNIQGDVNVEEIFDLFDKIHELQRAQSDVSNQLCVF